MGGVGGNICKWEVSMSDDFSEKKPSIPMLSYPVEMYSDDRVAEFDLVEFKLKQYLDTRRRREVPEG